MKRLAVTPTGFAKTQKKITLSYSIQLQRTIALIKSPLAIANIVKALLNISIHWRFQTAGRKLETNKEKNGCANFWNLRNGSPAYVVIYYNGGKVSAQCPSPKICAINRDRANNVGHQGHWDSLQDT